MVSRYEPIDVRTFEAQPHERSYIKISKLSDPSDFVKFEYNEFESFKINLTTGNVFFHGRINLNSSYLINWKSDKKDIIRNVEVFIVRAGNVDYYQFKAGIQTYFEDYTFLRFFVLLRHDNGKVGQKQFHSINPINYPLSLDIKYEYDKIQFKNAKTGSLVNLGLATAGMAVVLATLPAEITVVATITVLIGASSLISTTIKVVCEVTDNTDSWYYENNDFLQEISGWLTKKITKKINENFNTSYSETVMGEAGELAYIYGAIIFSSITSATQIKRIGTPASYVNLAKRNFEQGYLRIKKVTYKDSLANVVESAKRTFEGKTWAGDAFNALTLSKIAYDRYEEDFPKLKKFKRKKNSDEKE